MITSEIEIRNIKQKGVASAMWGFIESSSKDPMGSVYSVEGGEDQFIII